jgi:hypothetical protein
MNLETGDILQLNVVVVLRAMRRAPLPAGTLQAAG